MKETLPVDKNIFVESGEFQILIKCRQYDFIGQYSLHSVNEAFTLAEALQLDFLICIDDQNLAIVREDVSKIPFNNVAEKESEFSIRLLSSDGQTYILTAKGFIIDLKEQKTIALDKELRGHARVQQAEYELKKNYELLRQSEEIGGMGSWEFDINANLFHWSDGMFRIFGMSKDSTVIPETYLEYAINADKSIAQKIVNVFRVDHQPFTETIRIKSEGIVKTLKVKGSIIKDDKGLPSKVLGIDVDVTALAESEKALATQSHFIEQVIETIPDMVSVIELRNRKIEYINVRPFEQTGFSKQEMLQSSLEERSRIIHQDDRELVHNYFEKFLELDDQFVNTVEYRVHSNFDKNPLWFRANGRVFKRNKNGVPTHCVNVVQNITAYKRSQDELMEKNNAMKTMNEELANFAFLASHDLREPLRKIELFSRELLDRESGNLSARGKAFATRIVLSAQRMNDLIQDILAFSRTSYTEKKEHQWVDLNYIVDMVLSDLSIAIDESHAVIEKDTLPSMKGNAIQLSQLFSNIIDNAIKFRRPDQHPRIKIGSAHVHGKDIDHPLAKADVQYLKIAIIDNGIGFEPLFSEKIFHMFQRLHSKTEYAGTGMGLAICKKVVENHNGLIMTSSKPGEGSAFTCYFPVQP
jgi:PAS domain S-box-containing protein